ncbi:uncharacterized protein LOC144947785 [Lampetra fluviatilis]
MPILIKINENCIELPGGRQISFLPSPWGRPASAVQVQALSVASVDIPPGTQMLIPLRYRKPLPDRLGAVGVLLSPSATITTGLALVGAQTIVRPDQLPFLQVLNAGGENVHVPASTVVAHATTAFATHDCPHSRGVVAGVSEPRSSDDRWVAHLCDENSSLSMEQRGALRKLLLTYSDVFSSDDLDLGRTSLLYHHIETGDAAPIRLNSHRMSPAEREHVRGAVEDMLAADIISPSNSPWGAPVVLVKKKDGKLRFCVDFRKLNKISVADAYPLPRMDDSLDALSGAKFFSTLDLSSGFWQLPLDESSREKTAFRTPQGLFQFNCLPMGLNAAPATFQRLMELVLTGLQWETCLIYLDDIIVFSRTFDEHLTRLETVFTRMRSAKLKFKPKKCHLLQRSVRYLGHIVSAEGVSTDPEKTACVRDWPTPATVGDTDVARTVLQLWHEGRALRGRLRSEDGGTGARVMVDLVWKPRNPQRVLEGRRSSGGAKPFVPQYATVAKLRHALTAKNQRFKWGVEKAAFVALREHLSNAPPLNYPDFSLPFVLDTDASDMVKGRSADGVAANAAGEGLARAGSSAAKGVLKDPSSGRGCGPPTEESVLELEPEQREAVEDKGNPAAPKMAASRHVASTTVVMADGRSAAVMAAVDCMKGPSEAPKKRDLLVTTQRHVLWPSWRHRRRYQHQELEQNRAEKVELLCNMPPAVIRTRRRRRICPDVLLRPRL